MLCRKKISGRTFCLRRIGRLLVLVRDEGDDDRVIVRQLQIDLLRNTQRVLAVTSSAADRTLVSLSVLEASVKARDWHRRKGATSRAWSGGAEGDARSGRAGGVRTVAEGPTPRVCDAVVFAGHGAGNGTGFASCKGVPAFSLGWRSCPGRAPVGARGGRMVGFHDDVNLVGPGGEGQPQQER